MHKSLAGRLLLRNKQVAMETAEPHSSCTRALPLLEVSDLLSENSVEHHPISPHQPVFQAEVSSWEALWKSKLSVFRNTRIGFAKLSLICFKSCNTKKELFKLLTSEWIITAVLCFRTGDKKNKKLMSHVLGISWAFCQSSQQTCGGTMALFPFYR